MVRLIFYSASLTFKWLGSIAVVLVTFISKWTLTNVSAHGSCVKVFYTKKRLKSGRISNFTPLPTHIHACARTYTHTNTHTYTHKGAGTFKIFQSYKFYSFTISIINCPFQNTFTPEKCSCYISSNFLFSDLITISCFRSTSSYILVSYNGFFVFGRKSLVNMNFAQHWFERLDFLTPPSETS